MKLLRVSVITALLGLLGWLLMVASCTPQPAPPNPNESSDASSLFPQAADDKATPAPDHHHLQPPVELQKKAPKKKTSVNVYQGTPEIGLWPSIGNWFWETIPVAIQYWIVTHAHAQITTPKDTVPDFGGTPTIVSRASGEWHLPSTWAQLRVPQDGDVVRVAPGHDVTYSVESDAKLQAVGIEGRLRLSSGSTSKPNLKTRIKACDFLVYRTGTFEVGSAANPVRNLADVVIRDCALNPTTDPKQFATGIISFGKVIMHGRPKTEWLRFAQEPKAGDTVLVLESAPVGWNSGDKLLIPDTTQYVLAYQPSSVGPIPITLKIEEPEVCGIEGAKITLCTPLAFDHLAGRDTDGKVVALPHVGNLTRTIVVSSENPNGVRGHTLFTERAEIDIRFARFENLGRTAANPLTAANLIGRYPVHFHHLMGRENPTNTGWQGEFSSNVIFDGRKWCLAIHNSHWIRVTKNVIYQCQGAGIQTEQGNETGNLFEKNFIVKIGTTITVPYNPTYGGVAGAGRPLGFADFGWEGSCLWFNGQNNIVRDNVSANCAYAGVMYNERPSGFGWNHPLIPKVRGAQIGNAAQWDDYTKPYRGSPPVIESARNEVYASTVGTWASFGGEIGTLKDFLHWNIRQIGVYYGRSASITLENFRIVSQQGVSNLNGRTIFGGAVQYNSPATLNKCMDFAGTTYSAPGITIRNLHCEGFQIGVALPGNNIPQSPALWPGVTTETKIEGGLLRNYVNLIDLSPHAPKQTTLRDVKFIQNPGPANNQWLGKIPLAMSSALEPPTVDANIIYLSRLLSHNHNQVAGNNLEFFFPEQAPAYLMKARQYPSGVYSPLQNCPEQGLTNQQCREKFVKSTLDRIATCAESPEVRGFLCPVQ